MKYQPNRNYISNDNVMTPLALCERIIKRFKPSGYILEPCCGIGNFVKAISDFSPQSHITSHDISQGKQYDFLNKESGFYKIYISDFDPNSYDWIITNPPWSKFRPFLKRSLELRPNNIVFLVTVNHFMTKARLRDIREANFGFKEILFVDTPKEFPSSGFQLGAVHLQKYYYGQCKFSY